VEGSDCGVIEVLSTISLSICGAPDEIRTKYLQNTSTELCRFTTEINGKFKNTRTMHFMLQLLYNLKSK
jgi:hypothetical protein